MAKIKTAAELLSYKEALLKKKKDENKKTVAVCCGTGCNAIGAPKVVEAFRAEVAAQGLNDKVEIKATGCQGFCERGTVVTIGDERLWYQRVQPEAVKEIVEKTVKGGEVLDAHLYDDPTTGKKCKTESEIPFYKNQQRLLLGHNAELEPTSIDDYISIGGYEGFVKAVDMGADAVIDEMKKATVRGRGGGGFQAGRKWETCRNVESDKRYIICNADEGDPGAFMDCSILEGKPHSVIEGMLVAAFAIGSDEGYIYVRHEYPLAIRRLTIALEQAREKGFLGENILGSGLNFDIKINRGGGAFVCGESTALMASIEGQVGEPRAKHIHTVVSGLYGKPTNLNNVETYANVPLIMVNGADWYLSKGTKGSPGTKCFSLVGKVNNTGLVEAEMGTTLRQIIFDVGGGIANGRKFKAVQTGGPSGGCLPESKLDLSVDFDTLWEEGSMMGSGGMIVMDDATCMVDTAKYFLNFLKFESCGKCTTCREGLRKLHMLVSEVSEGKGDETTLPMIEELCEVVEKGSLCALGQTGVNPVKSTLKFFREEYEAHIKEKKCPAGVCTSLITYEITDACTGCLVCKKRCPENCISGEKDKKHVIDTEKCIKCGICMDACKFDAIRIY
ncbi:MAG: SLBB domain-containing protein [Deltaproteobacteria bacterium]|nr:SLBB domain-containing protein [Deltaproteobacteria bacterium]MBN2671192.1 SLBB domain-containing protein [Deltaproteobacteria bacterium]